MSYPKRILRSLVGWVWTPLLARGALWAGALVALAHVGSGAAVRTLAPATPTVQRGLTSAAARAAPTASPKCPPPPCSVASAGAPAALDLNGATAEQLQALPGIGAKRAQAIVALRERLGGFARLRDLMRVRGIGYRSLQRLTPLVKVGPAPRERRETKEGTP